MQPDLLLQSLQSIASQEQDDLFSSDDELDLMSSMKAKLIVSTDPERKYPIYDVGSGGVEKAKSSSLTKTHSSQNDVRDGELNVPP